MICVLVLTGLMGGGIGQTETAVAWAVRSGCEVRIEGECASACTMFLSAGCVAPSAILGFHAPTAGGKRMNAMQERHWAERMAAHLPPRLARWYLAGPAHDVEVTWISGQEAIRLGARACRP